MRIFKILLSLCIFIAIIVSAVIFALHYFISSDAIRIKLAQQLSVWTGYNVQLREAPQLDLYPYPRASLSGVTLTPMSDEAAPLMEAEKIEVNISLVDILFGTVSFSQTRIVRPHFIMKEPIQTLADVFNTVSTSNGALGLAVRDAQELLRTDPEHFDSTKIQEQPFGLIIIEDGQLQYHKTNNDYAETIKGINATINWPATNKQLIFVAKADWHGALSELRIEAQQPITLFAGGESQIKASFNSLRGGISFEGRAKLLHDYLFNGQISSLSPGLNQTIDWLLQESSLKDSLGAVLARNITSTVALTANFSAVADRVQFENLNLSIGNDTARGLLEINHQQEKPLINGSLAFNQLNLDNILANLHNNIDNNAINIGDFNKIGLDTRISVSQLTLNDTAFTNIAAALQIRNDNATIDLGNAVGFGGSLQSTFEIKNINTEAQGQARITGSNIDIDAVANKFGFQTALKGKAGFTLNMQANVKNWPNIVQNIHGEFIINMLAGQINGYDFSNLPNNILQNQKINLQSQAQLTSNFDRFDIEGDFSSNQFAITKAHLTFGDWTIASTGRIYNLTSGNQTEQNNYQISLDSQLIMPQENDTLCRTVLCLQYNLQTPVDFHSDINLKPNNYINITKVR